MSYECSSSSLFLFVFLFFFFFLFDLFAVFYSIAYTGRKERKKPPVPLFLTGRLKSPAINHAYFVRYSLSSLFPSLTGGRRGVFLVVATW